MAIDTVTKRKSVINDALPGLALLPPPDGTIEAIDRRRLTDFYSLGAQVVARNFWVPDQRDSAISWGSDVRASQSWAQGESAAEVNWVEETEVPVE